MNTPYVETAAERMQREQRLRRLDAAAAADARGRTVEQQNVPGWAEAVDKSGPSVAELQAAVHRWTIEKGWADARTVGDLLMLMVTEVAEAMEEWRNNHAPNEIRVHAGKPEGSPIELADVVIRILSFCGKFEIDLQDAILRKMAYNATRPHRHGEKRV